MNWLRIGGGVLGLIAIGSLLWIVADHKRLVAVEKAQKACIAGVKAKGDAGDISSCPAEIAARIETARRADACEAALQGANLSAVRAVCGLQVKRLQAERDAAAANLADTAGQLAGAKADRDAAVLRAEARATTTATRKAANDRTIETAPRTADGNVHCDAECLRRLAGD